MTKLSFSWSTRRSGNDGFVLEQTSSGHAKEFGPMPAHIVPAFIGARRRLVAMRAIAAGLEPTLENYDYMIDPADNTQRG